MDAFLKDGTLANATREMREKMGQEKAKWEENPLQTHYARSKYKAELHVWRGHSEGLDTVILNPSTILGFGDWTKSSCAIFKQMHDGFQWYTPGLNGFVDVQDVALATLLLLEDGKNGERYVVNGDTCRFNRVDQIQHAVHRVEVRRGFGDL